MKKTLCSLFSVFLFFSLSANASLDIPSLKTTVVTDQLKRPWSLAFLPNGKYLVTERGGTLRVVDKDGVISEPVQGLPEIAAVGQGGLLDVILHPNFKKNNLIYLSYVSGTRSNGFSTEVIRATLVASEQGASQSRPYRIIDSKKLFVALPKVKGGRHFGGRLAFDKKGYLFISLGDRGNRNHSQDIKTHHGSVIRLASDGQIPQDNPFLNRDGARPEIYSYGHRNVQGLAMHPRSGEMWSNEHGPQGGDEINRLVKGKNYGWPIITYGAEYGTGFSIGRGPKAKGMEQPLHYWDPSIAPSGMAFFGDRVLVGSLKFRLLSILKQEQNAFDEERIFGSRFGRIRDVRVKDRNTFYLLTDAGRGKLVRVSTGNSE